MSLLVAGYQLCGPMRDALKNCYFFLMLVIKIVFTVILNTQDIAYIYIYMSKVHITICFYTVDNCQFYTWKYLCEYIMSPSPSLTKNLVGNRCLIFYKINRVLPPCTYLIMSLNVTKSVIIFVIGMIISL